MYVCISVCVCMLPWVWEGGEIDRTQVPCSHNLSFLIIIKKCPMWQRISAECMEVEQCVIHTPNTHNTCRKQESGGGVSRAKCLSRVSVFSALTLRRCERVASHSSTSSCHSLWYVPSMCRQKLCFHFWFIYLASFDAMSQQRLHVLLLSDSVVMKVRKMCLELSLWPVFFFFLLLYFFFFTFLFFIFCSVAALIKFQLQAQHDPWWPAGACEVHAEATCGGCWLVDWNIVSFSPGVCRGVRLRLLWADTKVVSYI